MLDLDASGYSYDDESDDDLGDISVNPFSIPHGNEIFAMRDQEKARKQAVMASAPCGCGTDKGTGA